MTTLEKQIIQLISQNAHFSDELKKRYILSMFLMESDKQQEYLELLQKFTKRCEEMNRGIFIIKPSDLNKMMRTYEEVKKDLMLKLNTDQL